MNMYRKKVINDCAKSVFPSAVFNVLDTVCEAIITICVSSVLANLANAIFERNINYGIDNFGILVICILISLFVMPVFGTVKEILLFNNSLKHDRTIYERYLNKRFLEAQQITEGEVQYRLEQDSIDMRCLWLDLVTKCVATPVILSLLLYQTLRISILYTAIIFAISAIKLFVPILTKKLNVKYSNEIKKHRETIRSYEFEMLDRPHKIKMYGLTSPLLQRLDQVYFGFFRKTLRKSIRLRSLVSNLTGILNTFCATLILLSGAILTAKGQITAGSIAAAFGFYSVFNTLFANVAFLISNFPILGVIADRLEMFYTFEENYSGVEVFSIDEIVAENLSYSYDTQNVLLHVNFTVHKGDKVAICGKNGSGKSTLLKLLCGLLKDYSGHIKIGGQELSELCARSWYDCIAYVEQDPHLFPTSVRENIHIGNLKATDEDLDEVIRKLEIEDLADRDICVEKQQLSGGEKQKVSIARALLKEAPILIMDEPSNNLDQNSLVWLKNFINSSNSTIIYVTHESELLSCADDSICL